AGRDRRREGWRMAPGIEPPDHPGDRPRDAGAARALGAFGEELRIALVQANDRVAEAVRGEGFDPPAQPLCVEFRELQLLDLVGTDVERVAAEPGGSEGEAAQRERVPERRQR